MAGDPQDQLAQALDETERLVAGIGREQWDRPTPCPNWTVRDLVNHVVAGNRLFAALLLGEPLPPLADLQRAQGIDQLGDEPVASYRTAAQGLLAAFGQPGVLDRVFTVPIGPVPGIAALHLRITELLVHGWDLARATGQPSRYPDELAEQELTFTRAKLSDVPADRHPFGPPQPVSPDAPAIDQLAALLGRSVIDTSAAVDG